MNDRRYIEIHKALHRHTLVLGAERELVMLTALFCFLAGLSSKSLVGSLIVFLVWVFSLIGLRKMAKIDPLMSKVYLRHIKYQDFYSARSSRWRKSEGYKVK